MDYNKKTDEIYDALAEIDKVIYQFPLLMEMKRRKRALAKKYWARVNYNMTMYGKTKLVFDDIDYSPFKDKY
jgi:hypothetical protein